MSRCPSRTTSRTTSARSTRSNEAARHGRPPNPEDRMNASTTTDATRPADRLAPEAFAERAKAIEAEVGRVIVGQRDLVRQTLTGLLANSHVLLEGVPGLGKTMLVRTIADVIDCTFNRIQFTPD